MMLLLLKKNLELIKPPITSNYEATLLLKSTNHIQLCLFVWNVAFKGWGYVTMVEWSNFLSQGRFKWYNWPEHKYEQGQPVNVKMGKQGQEKNWPFPKKSKRTRSLEAKKKIGFIIIYARILLFQCINLFSFQNVLGLVTTDINS